MNVPLLDNNIQVEHKLHGATEPDREDYINRRHRDLLDVLIMRSDDEEFARRKFHKHWRPIFVLPKAWREELARDAKQIGLSSFDPDELARLFVSFIAEIEGINVKPTHEYEFLSLQLSI